MSEKDLQHWANTAPPKSLKSISIKFDIDTWKYDTSQVEGSFVEDRLGRVAINRFVREIESQTGFRVCTYAKS